MLVIQGIEIYFDYNGLFQQIGRNISYISNQEARTEADNWVSRFGVTQCLEVNV